MTTETPQPMNKRTAHLLLTIADRHLNTIADSRELLLEAVDAMDHVSAYYISPIIEASSPGHGAESASLLVDAMAEAGDSSHRLGALLELITSARAKLHRASELLPDLPAA